MKRRTAVVVSVVLCAVAIPLMVVLAVDLLEARRDGEHYARVRDQAACVRAVTRGRRVCKEATCFLRNRFFYRACMDRARPSQSLCSALPRFANLFQVEAWKNRQCARLGRTDRGCHHIWLRVLHACDR